MSVDIAAAVGVVTSVRTPISLVTGFAESDGVFMTVKELIEELQKLPPDTKVKVWDAYSDTPSDDVDLDLMIAGEVLIVSK
jgi:hypothetical protein